MKRISLDWTNSIVSLLILSLVSGVALCNLQAAEDPFSPPGPNIALNKSYRLEPAPNYDYCTDPEDTVQLTDGKTVKGRFWTQTGCVGWNGAKLVTITIDLGEDMPVGGLSFNTAAGAAGVSWPSAILVMVSGDGKEFRLAGELCLMSAQHGVPTPGVIQSHRFRTNRLRTRGRYVRLSLVVAGPYAFCDEIEVYRGPDELLTSPVDGPVVTDAGKFVSEHRTAMAIRNWTLSDLHQVRTAIAQADITAELRSSLNDNLAIVEKANETLLQNPPADYRAIYPLTDNLARLGNVVARLRRAEGYPSVFAWHNDRWAQLGPWDIPSEQPPAPPALAVRMAENERRAETINIANFTDVPINARAWFSGLPGGKTPGYITVHPVEYVAMQSGTWSAEALPAATRDGDAWSFTLHPGVSRQLWLKFYPRGNPGPGTYKGELVVELAEAGTTLSTPLQFVLEPVRLPDEPTVALTMWDYTAGGGKYDMNPGNIPAAVSHMRSYNYNAPWASTEVFPAVSAENFDAAGNLVKALDFSVFDAWAAMWPDARYYLIFIEALVGRHNAAAFAGAAVGTDTFHKRLSSTMRAWAAHARETGVDPGRIAFLIIDEPGGLDQARRITAWANAINAGAPELRIYEDPHVPPEHDDALAMLALCDILCPPIGKYRRGGARMSEFYEKMRQGDRELWFYSSPTQVAAAYHRDHVWELWKAQGTGIGFWSYASASGIGNTWNQIGARGPIYSPVFIDSRSVTDGKHWLAIIEGIQDYEYMRILRDRVKQMEADGKTNAALTQAKGLLKTLPNRVLASDISYDEARLAALDALLSLGSSYP